MIYALIVHHTTEQTTALMSIYSAIQAPVMFKPSIEVEVIASALVSWRRFASETPLNIVIHGGVKKDSRPAQLHKASQTCQDGKSGHFIIRHDLPLQERAVPNHFGSSRFWTGVSKMRTTRL